MSDIEVHMIDHMGNDATVVNSARVSFRKDDHLNLDGKLSESDEKLIKYLAKHKHTSPLNHAFAQFKCKAPIFVARQLVKHEYLVWNEVSRRYTSKNIEMFWPNVWSSQSKIDKQGSGEPLDISINNECSHLYEHSVGYALDRYHDLLKLGVSKEEARMVLPQATMTEWYWSGSLGAFAKMCKLRLDWHTQSHTRQVAERISFYMKEHFPVSWEALVEGY